MMILLIFLHRLRLNTMTLQVTSTNVYSAQGVSISVTGIAQVHTLIHLVLLINTTIKYHIASKGTYSLLMLSSALSALVYIAIDT